MKKLHPLWFLDEPIDFEHKQYILLDYVEFVKKSFKHLELHPCLQNIIEVSSATKKFIDRRVDSPDKFKKFLIDNDINNIDSIMELHGIDNKKPSIQTINSILEWSSPILLELIEEGQNIWQTLSEDLDVYYIGTIPKSKTIGLIGIFNGEETSSVHLYEYCMTSTSISDSYGYMGFHVQHKQTMDSPSWTDIIYDKIINQDFYESLETNSLVIVVQSKLTLPLDETLIPITKNTIHERLLLDFFKSI